VGVVANPENFSFPAMTVIPVMMHIYVLISFFEILLPPPSPYSQAQDPDGEFRWGVGGRWGRQPAHRPQ
jgi:hypothetical protein